MKTGKSKEWRQHSEYNWSGVIINYLGKICVYCGSQEKLHIHHIIPMDLGGPNTMENLEVVCKLCHHKLHSSIRTILKKKHVPKNNLKMHGSCKTFGVRLGDMFFCIECNCAFV